MVQGGPSSQSWKTFFRNHAQAIAAIDLCVVPTLTFERLFAFLVLGHGRRQLLWFEVTRHPTAEWLARQITEAFPWASAPAYLVRDNDRAYGHAFRSRVRAMGIRDRIIIVMQRVHMNDLTGFVLGQSDEWTVLSLPAIAESFESIRLTMGRVHQRQPGEVLSPDREPMEVLEQLRAQLGSDLFSAQYQQAPVPPGGAMIKRHWIRRYTEVPPASAGSFVLQSWDTAAKGGPDNDWSVCTTWLSTNDNQFYLRDVWRGRVDYPTLKAKVQELAKQWGARQVLIEEAGTAIGLLAELRFHVRGLTRIKPDRDKLTRMSIASAIFEAGQVHFPERAPWLAELEAELFSFPGSRHDDQVDSISQVLNHARSSSLWTWRKMGQLPMPLLLPTASTYASPYMNVFSTVRW